jgi:translocation and assembly module TamB
MRALRLFAAGLGAVLALAVLAVAALLVGLNTDPGRRLAERVVQQATGGQVTVTGLAGTFPTALRVAQIEVWNAGTVWLTVQNATLDWSPARLLAGEVRVGGLTATRVAVAGLPVSSGASNGSSSGGLRVLPVRVVVQRLHVDRLEIAAPVAGVAAALSVDGSARLASLHNAEARLALDRLDGPGTYRLDGRIAATSVLAHLRVQEPARGLVSQITGLPELGAINATASVDGPWNEAALKLAASAGPLRADASGTLDLNGMAADLDISATAPAMRPRPDLAWQRIAVEAHLHGRFAAPEANATLVLDNLEAAGAGLQRLSMRAFGHAGAATLEATAEGVRLPGPKPLLLAAAPLHLTAEAALDAPDRPVKFSVSHPLVAVEGTARTAGALSVDAKIGLPDLAPLAALGGVELQGRTALTVRAARDAAGTHVDVDGSLGVTGGMIPVPALLGPDAKVGLSAVLQGSDVTLSRLQLDGQVLTVTAQGDLHGGDLALDWRAGISDLAAVAEMVRGTLSAQGRATGRTDDLSVSLDLSGDVATAGFPRSPVHASVQARGLPGNPSGSVTAEGALDGSSLSLAAQATRATDGALHVEIARADWRSAHADGVLDLPLGAALPLGAMTLKVDDLSDFSSLVGRRLVGSIDAALRTEQQDGAPVAVLDLRARNAGLPGQVIVGEAKLAARVRDPAGNPVSEARLDATGLRADALGGGLRLDATGPLNALALKLAANLTGVAGADLSAQAAGTLDALGRTLGMATMQVGWKGETLRLLGPARLSFGDGVAVDRGRFGLRGAVLEVAGRVSPTLDLIASLRNVTADLARIVIPDLQADGRLEADAKLGGTPTRPTGTVRLAATGMHMRSGAASGLPAASLSGNAALQGETARLDVAATAGRSRLTLAGTVPLASGTMDLHAAGMIDLSVFDPILAANGRRVKGRLALDAGVTGTAELPRIAGTLRLTGGEVQDFSLGARLEDIEAEVQANGDGLRIARFVARAGKGTISAGGTVGLATPMPVALTLTARNASPLSSDRLTAVLDSDLTLRGEAAGRLDVAGKITIQRADIRLPESMPTRVAVLKVLTPGQKPQPVAAEPDIGLDMTLSAPGRIVVRGRGLDAELAGDLRINGTVAAPQPSGSFKLRRGQFTLAGTTLEFARGEVGFDGSGRIDPTLKFLASSNNGTVVANLAITGYASAPKFALSSTPELPQDEVLAWLLFHQSATTLSPLQLVQIAQGLAQISGVGGGFDPLGRLRSGLGLDRLSVGSGQGGKGAAVEAGRYVAEGVYVGAKQGTNGSGTQATVQIDLAHGLKLETTVGQDQNATGSSASGSNSGTSVGLTYQFEY